MLSPCFALDAGILKVFMELIKEEGICVFKNLMIKLRCNVPQISIDEAVTLYYCFCFHDDEKIGIILE